MAIERTIGVSADQRALFLAHLGETANVAKSCKVANIASGTIYRLRETNKAFREGWLRALNQGYVQLEAHELAFALSPPAPNISEKTLKQLAMKQRSRQQLLAAHRAEVRGETKRAPDTLRARMPTLSEARRIVTEKLDTMRPRLIDDDHDQSE